MAPWTQQAKNGTWRAQYRDAAGRKRYTSGHRSKKEAERAAVIEESEARRGQRRDPTSHRMRYGQWVERWQPTRGVEASTTRSDGPRMKNHVLPRWENVRLSEISRMDVQAWVLALHREPQPPRNRPLSASTTRHCLALLSSSLKAAVEENILDSNPCTGVRRPALPLPDERFLTDDEVDRLFAELDGWPRLLVELLLDTGMRIGEAAALHRHRVVLDRGDPHLVVFEAWNSDERVMQPHPKGKQRRTVPMSFGVAEDLQRYWDRHPDLPRTCLERHEDGAVCRSGLAVPNAVGRPVDPSNFSQREWAAAVEASGVTARPHDLRHTAASRLITAGVPLERVQKLLGHVSFTTTLRYARLMDDGRDEVRDALSARREAVVRQRRERPCDAMTDAAANEPQVRPG